MQRNRRTSWGLRDMRKSGHEGDQTGNLCRNRNRLTAVGDGLTGPSAERRMRRIMIVVRMLTGAPWRLQHRRARGYQTHQSKIDHRRDSGDGASNSADARDIHV